MDRDGTGLCLEPDMGVSYYKLRLMHEIVFFLVGVPISEICL
jgi:hypothetical protein